MEARDRLMMFLPHLRYACEQAREKGQPYLGVIAIPETGDGHVIAKFEAESFLADLCDILGAPRENTDEQRMEAAATAIHFMFGGGK